VPKGPDKRRKAILRLDGRSEGGGGKFVFLFGKTLSREGTTGKKASQDGRKKGGPERKGVSESYRGREEGLASFSHARVGLVGGFPGKARLPQAGNGRGGTQRKNHDPGKTPHGMSVLEKRVLDVIFSEGVAN